MTTTHVYRAAGGKVALCGLKRRDAGAASILARFVPAHRANYPLQLCEGCEDALVHPERLFE